MAEAPRLLLDHQLKSLKLPTVLREYDKQARIAAGDGVDHVGYLARLTELELIDRERRLVERRIKQARFPIVKQLESFDFKAVPELNKMLVLDLARGEYVARRENVILLGPSGVGKTHIALALGLAACQKGLSVRFTTASQLVHELMEARDEKRLLRLQAQLAKVNLLIVDELGYVPLSQTGSELLFEIFSQRYERGATIVTSNLPFQEWTSVFASERLTGALLDRITHHVHILEMNAESYERHVAPRAGPSYGLRGQAATEPLVHCYAAALAHIPAAVDILFRQIDNNAASVRQKLVDQGLRALTGAERSDWVRFLMSLRIRQPDLIREIVADSADGLRASLESQPDEYEAIAGEGYPPTLVEWANGEFPGLIENFGLSFLHELVAVEKIGEKIFGLKWWLWDFGDAKHELLLSDNPCIFTGALDAPNLIVALPISPTRAFLASRGMRVTANIRGLDSSTLATRLNSSSVLQARARVYSRTAGARRFIENQIYGRR